MVACIVIALPEEKDCKARRGNECHNSNDYSQNDHPRCHYIRHTSTVNTCV